MGWLPVGIFTRPLKQSGVTSVRQNKGPCYVARGLMVVLSGNSKSVPSLGAGFRPRDGLEVWPESHWPGFALRQTDVL